MSTSKSPYPWDHWPQQSPINFSKNDSLYMKFPKSFLKIDYRDAPFTGKFKGEPGHKNFVLDRPHPSKKPPVLTIGDVQAELVKIHLHTPSEHDLEGSNLGGEIHLIHEIANPTSGSQLVVVGVFFDENEAVAETAFFSLWASQASRNPSAKTEDEQVHIDPRTFLPKSNQWYRYEGSLTSEPYSEIVSWLVFTSPIGVGSVDLKKLKKNAHQPERPVQPIHRRFVIRSFR